MKGRPRVADVAVGEGNLACSFVSEEERDEREEEEEGGSFESI